MVIEPPTLHHGGRNICKSQTQNSSVSVQNKSHKITSEKMIHSSGHNTLNSKNKRAKIVCNIKLISIPTRHLFTTNRTIF